MTKIDWSATPDAEKEMGRIYETRKGISAKAICPKNAKEQVENKKQYVYPVYICFCMCVVSCHAVPNNCPASVNMEAAGH